MATGCLKFEEIDIQISNYVFTKQLLDIYNRDKTQYIGNKIPLEMRILNISQEKHC